MKACNNKKGDKKTHEEQEAGVVFEIGLGKNWDCERSLPDLLLGRSLLVIPQSN